MLFRSGEGRHQTNRLAEVIRRVIMPPPMFQDQTQAVMRQCVVRIDLQRLPEMTFRFAGLTKREMLSARRFL